MTRVALKRSFMGDGRANGAGGPGEQMEVAAQVVRELNC